MSPHVCAPAYSEGVENAINTGTKQWHEWGKQLMDLKIGRSSIQLEVIHVLETLLPRCII